MKNTLLIITFFLIFFRSQSQTITDIDGNVYNVITIGSQSWMKENLKVTHYLNGDEIPHVEDQVSWNSLTTGARSYYFNDSITYAPVYGALYNWWAVTDSRKLCPEGWYVPTDDDWHTLVFNIDTNAQSIAGTESYIAGGEMKEADTIHWDSPNIGATNGSGFTALPGGRRYSQGYSTHGTSGYFWSSSPAFMGYPWYRKVQKNTASIERWGFPEFMGSSVRCVKDTLINKTEKNIIDFQFQFYPNPINDRVLIETFEIQNFKIEIIDISGRSVLTKECFSNKAVIDLSTLSKGIYVVRISDNYKLGIKKLIKQ